RTCSVPIVRRKPQVRPVPHAYGRALIRPPRVENEPPAPSCVQGAANRWPWAPYPAPAPVGERARCPTVRHDCARSTRTRARADTLIVHACDAGPDRRIRLDLPAESTMSELPFAKGQALGNDYIVVDAADLDAPPSGPFIRALCDRHRGVGS